MNGRRAGYAAWLMLCGVLYFFENNAGTRAVLLGSILMETALAVKAGEEVDRVIHPEERVFSDYDDLTALAPRGY